MKGLYLTVSVWGEAFCSFMLDYLVPSLMSQNNLPGLRHRADARFLIACSAPDVPILSAHPNLHWLGRQIEIDLMPVCGPVRDLTTGEKFGLLVAFEMAIIRRAQQDDCAIVHLSPDCVVADGTLRLIDRAIDEGKRAVMLHAPSANAASALPLVERWRLPAGRDGTQAHRPIEVPPRPLMKLAVDHLHPDSHRFLADGGRLIENPSFLYWRAGTHGMVCRCPHLGQLYVHPRRWDVPASHDHRGRTLDQSWVARAVPDIGDYLFCEDSDDGAMLELSPPDKPSPPPAAESASPAAVARFMSRELVANNVEFLKRRIWLHDGQGDGDHADAVSRSDMFIDEVLRHLPHGHA